MKTAFWRLLSCVVCCILFVSRLALAEEAHCPRPVAEIVSAQGQIESRPATAGAWQALALHAPVCPGDTIRLGAHSRGAILFIEAETVVRLDENTTTTIQALPSPDRSLLDLIQGAVHFFSRVPRSLEVKTPYVTAGIEGTEFFVRVDPVQERTFITVFEGVVTASNDQGDLILTRNQSAEAVAGRGPELRVVVRPLEAVQWTLYYQPVLAVLAAPRTSREEAAPRLRELQEVVAEGGAAAALRWLDRLPESERNETTALWRAALLMRVGRWSRAREILDGLVRRAPENAVAHALLAVIHVTQNRTADALEAGREAVRLDPESSPARIALSYARQGDFDLEGARDALLKAVEVAPEDALAWARLSELWLSLGYRGKALEAADKAVVLAPDLARAQTVLGFAALIRIDLGAAKTAFEQAIQLRSDDPLPRLGFGLAKIRGGDFEAGRREIEIAAALASNSSLIRSYLGKAYFEEKRGPLDAVQFEIAKALDPNDPTPWFYDAIRKQTENRPIDAHQDIERSIALNDNRAVYRSRLLLDEDLAVRGTSLGRIYQDLGFERLALVEGTRSLTHDPANYSAHRFLADSYALRKRHEIARVSEQLQAQLLQPLNNEPVQPRLNQADLTIVPGTGPAEAAFNEFTSLFARDQIRFTGTGLVGSNDTWGDEAVISGIVNRFSYSVGQFHHQDDGFRPNNDQEHDIYNAFAQAALTDQLNVQLEFRRRRTDEGDLRLDFDPSDFSTTDRRSVDQDTARLGAHYAPRPGIDLIGSLIYSEREDGLDIVTAGPTIDRNSDTEAYDAQIQGLFRSDRWNLIAGGGLYDITDDSTRTTDFSFLLVPLPPPLEPFCPLPFPGCINAEATEIETEQRNAYGYLNVNYPETVTWTLGLSYDSFDNGVLETDEVNPKFGVQWDINNRLRLRGTALRMLKRQLIVDQTLEPTSVAGFNQFFDDANGTVVDAYGIGLDVKFKRGLYGGIEATKRELEVPILDFFAGSITDIEDHDEERASAYLYWAPHSDWALRTEVEYERFERHGTGGSNLPTEIKMLRVPLAVRYFNSSGLFGEFGLTYVHQEVGLPPASTFRQDDDDFVVVDAALGFRLPKRRGILSLEVRNLFDKEFLFQDSNLQSSEPSTPRFIPERTIFARFTLAF